MDIKIDQQVRGTRILVDEDARIRRAIINNCIKLAESRDFREIVLPTIEPSGIYTDKMGPEILNQLFAFKDRGERPIVLRPEGTATCQVLARTTFQQQKNIRLWYETRCFRYERPQAGRYREFTQFGVEILNAKERPQNDFRDELIELAQVMISGFITNFTVDTSAKRGLQYYTEDGFEISCPLLGAEKQIVGGGRYAEGIGFAIGVDRLMLAYQKEQAPIV